MTISAPYRPLRQRLAAPVLALALGAAALTGCAGETATEPQVSSTPSPGDLPITAAPTTPWATPRTAVPTPTRTPSRPAEGSGDGEGDDEPAAAGGGICVDLAEAEVAGVLGGSVTGAAIPGGGCAFTQARPRPPAANFIEVPFAEMAGGMSGAKENAISAVEGDPEDVSAIGDEAFVVTGTSFGGTQLQGAGAVRVGDRLISVNLAQSTGLSRERVRTLVLGLLRLAVAQTG
ncbi:MAG: hypothetical protein NTV23_14730 [Propionibacteriales bacterium]|nr:hypothetical protein [Propionibacteriales bacterium]